MSAGILVLNQPGVYLVDADGNVLTLVDGATIGTAEGFLIAGKDGTVARFVKVSAASRLVTDGSEVTQPISVASLPLPAGAATAALQTQPGTDIGDVTVNNNSGAGAVNIQDGGNSITIDNANLDVALSTRATEATLAARLAEATFTSRINTQGQKTMAQSTPVVIASDQSTLPVSAASLPLPTGAATEATLATLTAKDFATQTTLAALLTAFNAEDFATQFTLAALLSAFNAEDFATQTTLAALLTAFNAEDFATQTTLATRLADATFTARVNVLGQNTMAASTPMVIASDQSAVASKNAAASQVDGHSVSIGATTDADTALTVIGRLKNLLSRIPAALVGGRFDQNMGSWFGSTVPTVGQKAMVDSIPVALASNQTAVLVTFTGTRTGVVGSIISLGGGTANSLQVMRATPYNEPTANAQRSFSSNNANDTAAGTGARTVHFTYYTTTGTGPFVEVLTLNGTTPVNTVATNIRFIEEMDVVTAGSVGANIGTITMHSTTGGGGTVVGTIGVGNILTGVGDQRTLWAHHYVEAGVTASLSTLIVGAQSAGSGTSARFFVKSAEVLVPNAVDLLVGDVLLVQGAFSRLFSFYVRVTGFVRLTAYAIPSVNNTVLSAAFDYSET